MDQEKCDQSQRKRGSIVSGRRPQTEQTGNVAHKNENKDRADIVHELRSSDFSHRPVHDSVELLDENLQNILEAFRYFLRMLHRAVCRNPECRNKQYHDENADM